MLPITVEPGQVHIGSRFSVSFQRTLRIPDDGQRYPLPPGLGAFPIQHVEDYREQVPALWREQGGVFIPMYQREALWLGFEGASWKPNAVKVGIGRINAVSGTMWEEQLHAEPQDYIVCPDQPWLDGINVGVGTIRQFVAMSLESGYTVESQVTGTEKFGGIQIIVYEPKADKFPDLPPPNRKLGPEMMFALETPASGVAMGLGAGGRMRQRIYPDSYGIDTWDQENYGLLFVHIVNSEQYRALTGLEPPPTPVSAQTYTDYGLPWFDLYDEAQGTISASETLASVRSIQEQDLESGTPISEKGAIAIDADRIKRLYRRTGQEKPE